MDGSDQILDQDIDPRKNREYVDRHLASGGTRFLNYLIDVVVYYVLTFVLGFAAAILFGDAAVDTMEDGGAGQVTWTLIVLLLLLLYYIVMEAATGRTIGKYITKSRVVTEDGGTPTLMNIVGRTLCRLIPFEAFSFLGSTAVGWHDSISNTRVIKD